MVRLKYLGLEAFPPTCISNSILVLTYILLSISSTMDFYAEIFNSWKLFVLFLQKVPSWMFDCVLITLLQNLKTLDCCSEDWVKFGWYDMIENCRPEFLSNHIVKSFWFMYNFWAEMYTGFSQQCTLESFAKTVKSRKMLNFFNHLRFCQNQCKMSVQEFKFS